MKNVFDRSIVSLVHKLRGYRSLGVCVALLYMHRPASERLYPVLGIEIRENYMKDAKKGDWVQVKSIELPKGHRAPQVPEDTQKCDLIKWVKGFIRADAQLGEYVEVTTITGRLEKGELCAIKPGYSHNFGRHVPELLQVQHQLHNLMAEGEQ